MVSESGKVYWFTDKYHGGGRLRVRRAPEHDKTSDMVAVEPVFPDEVIWNRVWVNPNVLEEA